MELKQQLKLTQQLVMTPQLQQAIKLLQLSRIELTDLIQHELDENPALDEMPAENDASLAEGEQNQAETAEETPEQPEFDWTDYVDQSEGPRRTSAAVESREDFDPLITRPTSFADHLLWQLHLYDLSAEEMEIGENIIGNLDSKGYLTATYEEIVEATGRSLEMIQQVHQRIMRLDPVGVAARSLQECLLAQAAVLPGDMRLVTRILTDHMHDLERKRYQVIARQLKVPLKEVLTACDVIANMEPRPGRGFSDAETQYITPDIYVHKQDGEWVVVLNEDGQPRLRVNSFYKNILAGGSVGSDKAREYIQEKLRSAVWLIKSVYHRQSTIVSVMKSIINFQHDFFEFGPGNLKPLVLRDVAEDINMHESNISRITTNKYVHTPHGIFELKYFFNSGLASDSGEAVASESVKNTIRDIIRNENAYKPYSDQDIADMLKSQGVHIARRTVTKYREMLGVLSSSKRKKHR